MPHSAHHRISSEFQLGMVLSGGATRGAYTAGVLDYLLEVLASWEKAIDQKDPNLPQWTLNIRNIVSSSAGALAAVLSAASITAYHEPMPRNFKAGDTPPLNNLLYRGWVSEFTMERLFDCSDLPPHHAPVVDSTQIKSLLNSKFMHEIAHDLCRDQLTDQPVPSWAHDLQLFFTFMNMRGVPYSFEMDGSLDQSARKFAMLSHADNMGFSTGFDRHSHLFPLNLQQPRTSPMWQKAFKAATASAAIPCVFPSVLLDRPVNHYEDTNKIVSTPSWPQNMPSHFMFNASDGGMLDNEPVGLCRDALQRAAERDGMESDGAHSWGAILLIDTGSNSKENLKFNDDVQALNVWQNMYNTLMAIRSEARLKDEELIKASDKDDFSQYIISPLREGRKPGEPALATATLNKFGGILDIRFRHHDFMLGRHNCQQFLRNHFTVRVKDAQHNPIFKGLHKFAKHGQESVPIIPIVGSAAEECPVPNWPWLSKTEKNSIIKRFKLNATARAERLLITIAKASGILRPPTSWWKLWARMWRRAILTIIQVLAKFAFQQIEYKIKLSLGEF